MPAPHFSYYTKLQAAIEEIEQQTPDPIERWTMLKGWLLATKARVRYSAEYNRNVRAQKKQASP